MGVLGKRGKNQQEQMARDFDPNESIQHAGILCVFQVLNTAQLGQKIRQLPQMIFSSFPYKIRKKVYICLKQ